MGWFEIPFEGTGVFSWKESDAPLDCDLIDQLGNEKQSRALSAA